MANRASADRGPTDRYPTRRHPADRRPAARGPAARVVHPTRWATPAALAYEDARDFLRFALRARSLTRMHAHAALRTVAAYARHTGVPGLDGTRLGTHLVAGHVAAECIAVRLREIAPDDHDLHMLVDAVQAALWPGAAPTIPGPESMRAGAALRRYRRASEAGVPLPGLHHLAVAAMSAEYPVADRYTSALHRLIAATHRHHDDTGRLAEAAGMALAAVLSTTRVDSPARVLWSVPER